jgi:hypothetical protein
MIDIEFEFKVEDTAIQNGSALDPLLDEFELNAMFDHTREQISHQVQTKLAHLRCSEHDRPPRVKITGIYSPETEQLDIQYHLDTCCKRLLLEAVGALNH